MPGDFVMRNVALVQVNYQFGNNVFLPHSVGLIRAYCETIPEISDNFNFLDFVYLRGNPSQVAQQLDSPNVIGVSCYLWNWEWSKALAKNIKARHPDCLVVLGGPQVPVESQNFFERHPYADILVHYEGELIFADILLEYLKEEPDYTTIPGVSVRLEETRCLRTPGRERSVDINSLPSPYVAGCFDYLLDQPYDFHASQETHRGCPYSCTFCDWGSAVFTKVRPFSDERLEMELEWFGKNQIELLYNCDANYGLLRRDLSLTQKMVDTKKTFGFPKQFRAAYAKNSNLKVFEIAKLLNDAGMNKGVTLSFQSLDDRTLEAIKRTNIKVQNLQELIGLYRREGIATYTELIMGLPGETYGSFANGIEKMLEAGQHDGLNIYVCIVIQNSELADPDYIAQHGIRSVTTPVLLQHSSPSEDPLVEYNDIVVETNCLPLHDFKRVFLFSWVVQTCHCLGLTQYLSLFTRSRFGIGFRAFYERLLEFAEQNPQTILGREFQQVSDIVDAAVEGGSWGMVVPRFGKIIWPTEEASFLSMVCDKDRFYAQISQFLRYLLSDVGATLDDEQLNGLLCYQRNMIIDPFTPPTLTFDIDYDFHEYFEAAHLGTSRELRKRATRLTTTPEQTFQGDLELYARTIVWYGRKANKFRHTNIRVDVLE